MVDTSAANSKSTQEFVPIKEIRDGVVVLKDGSMRALLMCSSVNFALKSGEEQNSILFQFQNFLNSLDFSIQIFVQSRRLDIRPYLALIEGRIKDQTNDLMRVQIKEYVKFIKKFTEDVNIMAKTFFIVVPYTPPMLNVESKKFSLFGSNKASRKELIQRFDEDKTQLEKRVGVVESGISRCGVRTAQLGTEELVEVFYKLFNPGDVEKPIPVIE
jgi:type IV secretory pathway VirB4 component